MAKETKSPKILNPKGYAFLIIIIAIIGLISSTVLTLDKIHVIKDPNYNPACNINPVFSCGSVMKTKQAEIAGVPNTLVGLITFPMLLMVGIVILFGAEMRKRFWQLIQIVTLAGLAGAVYLFYQGVYRINALCLYCMSVWFVVILLSWYTTLWNIKNAYITLPKSFKRAGDFALKHHFDILVVIYLIVASLIVNHFWYYFKTWF